MSPWLNYCAYIFECIPITYRTPKTFDLTRLLSKMDDDWQHLLDFRWEQIPIKLIDHFIAFIKCKVYTLEKLTNDEHNAERITGFDYCHQKHCQIVALMLLKLKFNRK